jgi:hypothetical protein
MDHVVQFYDRAEDLTANVGRYLAGALHAGGGAIVAATGAQLEAFSARLPAEGVNFASARASGDLIVLDAAETLATLMVNGRPDRARFDTVIGHIVREQVASGRPIRVYGEMVALLWDQGLVTGAIELEDLWNDLGGRVPMSLFCAYPAA